MRIAKSMSLLVFILLLCGCGAEKETWKNESDSSKWLEIPENGENAFLVQAGFDDAEIFFEKQYEKEKVVLYFDEKLNRGCGLLYTVSEGESYYCLGYLFEGCEVIDGDDIEPYSVYYAYDLSGVERYEYALDEIPKEDIIECEYEDELLQHISLYVTHGANERFYIYEGGKDTPKYCLTLDPGWGACLCRFE